MNKRILFSLLFVSILATNMVKAQLSNNDLLGIKETTDQRLGAWNNAFDEGVAKKSLATLPTLRGDFEKFLNENISVLSRLYASGDARPLLTAVKNYLQIHKQFVRTTMQQAEATDPTNPDEVSKINRGIGDFASKTKPFLIDINNALRDSPEPMPQVDEEMTQDEPTPTNPEEVKKKQETKPRRKGKLPHEKEEAPKQEEE